MSRPRSSSGEYGRMPCTCSTVVSTVNSGTISTMPPMATVSNDPTRSMRAFFSNHSWRIRSCIVLFPRHGEAAQRGLVEARCLGCRAGDSTSQVIGHDQAANQEQHAADHAQHQERMDGDDGFDERVLKEAELVVCTPHQ